MAAAVEAGLAALQGTAESASTVAATKINVAALAGRVDAYSNMVDAVMVSQRRELALPQSTLLREPQQQKDEVLQQVPGMPRAWWWACAPHDTDALLQTRTPTCTKRCMAVFG